MRKAVPGGFESKRRILRKHQFLLSQTHIGRLLDSTISSKNPLRSTAKNALEKRLTKERNKTLAGSILGGSGPKMCPKRLPSELPSRFIFRIFFNFSLRRAPGASGSPQSDTKDSKCSPGGHKIHPGGTKSAPADAKIQPSSNQLRHPEAKSAKNPASPHSTRVSKNIEVRRCRVSVLNYVYF